MISLILMSGFLTVVVFFRVFIQYRRTGDFGVRAAPVGSPLIEVLPGTIFVLTFCFALSLVIKRYVGYLETVVNLSPHIEYAGFFIALSGIMVTVVSQLQMGDSWRIGVDQQESTTLITNGLYGRSRNPIYFGILLFWIGLSITFPHPLLWISASVCWICIELIVRKIEEPYLRKEHGAEFQNYVARTNRYLPL